MSPAEFQSSLSKAAPPKGLSASIIALWWAKKGDWERAHKLVMDEEGPEAAWSMPTSIAWRAISATRAIGTGRLAVRRRQVRSRPNGTRLHPNCWRAADLSEDHGRTLFSPWLDRGRRFG